MTPQYVYNYQNVVVLALFLHLRRSSSCQEPHKDQRLKQSFGRSSMDLFLLAILSLISLHSQVLSLPLFLYYLYVYTFIFPRMNLLNQFTHSFRLDLKLENWNLITIFTSIQVAYGDPSVVFLDSPTRNYLRQPSAEVDIYFFVEIFI